MVVFGSVLAFTLVCATLQYVIAVNPFTSSGRETKISKIFEEGMRKSGEIEMKNRRDVINALKTGIKEVYGRNKRLLELNLNHKSIQTEVNPNAICERCEVFVGFTVQCYCTGDELDVIEQFTNISQELESSGESKLFDEIDIWQATLTEFPENSFVDLEFRDIIIQDSRNLSRVHTNAFNSTAFSVANNFFLYNMEETNTMLTNQPPDYDLYAALSSMVNVTAIFITLGQNMVHEIPDNAFRNINGLQRNLNAITFEIGYTISRVGEYAFSQLPALNDGIIDLSYIPIEHISPHAFDFNYESDYYVDIDLRYCNLTEDSFDVGSFIGRNRPLSLRLSNNRIRYIRQEVFYDFFESDHRGEVYFDDNPLNCSDTEPFEWLLLSPIRNEYMARLIYPFCENGTVLWDIEVGNPNNTSPTSNPVTCPSVSCPNTPEPTPSRAPIISPGNGSFYRNIYYFKVILVTHLFCFITYAINIRKFL